MNNTTRVLSTATLAMITVAAIVSLRNLPLTAELGSSAVFYLSLAALIFFIPIALVTAELASTWPRSGGCYVWVSEAFGKPVGFVALWLSWMASIAWFPAILAFTATMLAHMLAPIYPGLENNTVLILAIMLLVFWGTTLSNFFGIKFSGFLSSNGVIIGTLIPGALIITLGLYWILAGHPMEINLDSDALVPDLKLDNLNLFAGVVLGFAGIDLATYHIREAKDPQKSYPRALLLAMVLILAVYVFGTLAIAIVVPQKDLSLASGLIQAFAVFLAQFNLSWALPLAAAVILIGALAGINSWVVGPAKGMLAAAEDGFLPAWLQRVNKYGVPTSLLLVQAIVGSILAMLFLYIRDNDSSIWFLTALSAQFTCLQYILVFAAALQLRRSQAQLRRAFRVPIIWLIAAVGIAACVFSFLIVYVPHPTLVVIDLPIYWGVLIIALLALIAPALLLSLGSKPIASALLVGPGAGKRSS